MKAGEPRQPLLSTPYTPGARAGPPAPASPMRSSSPRRPVRSRGDRPGSLCLASHTSRFGSFNRFSGTAGWPFHGSPLATLRPVTGLREASACGSASARPCLTSPLFSAHGASTSRLLEAPPFDLPAHLVVGLLRPVHRVVGVGHLPLPKDPVLRRWLAAQVALRQPRSPQRVCQLGLALLPRETCMGVLTYTT